MRDIAERSFPRRSFRPARISSRERDVPADGAVADEVAAAEDSLIVG